MLQNKELALVLITNKSLERSLTGHIIKEIFSGGVKPLELIEVRMFAPSEELISEYIELIIEKPFRDFLYREYIQQNRGPVKKRIMLLLFSGENAISQIRGIVGPISRRIDGTIRNSFAEFEEDESGNIKGFFDPSVIIIPEKEVAEKVLRLWAKYSKKDGGLLRDIIDWEKLIEKWDYHEIEALKHREGLEVDKEALLKNIQTTLVLIKPDNIYTKSRRVGEIINALSGPGLKLIGAKAVNMSINQAVEFYAPIEKKLIARLGEDRGRKEFSRLIEFMTGRDPYKVEDPEIRNLPGDRDHQSLALVYQGPFAISRIRRKIGATNPQEAEPGTIRREYGHDIMRNGVHASDSPSSARREIEILDFEATRMEKVVNEFFPPS